MPKIPQDATQFVTIGWLIIIVGIIGSSLWAGFAPLDKGVSVAGQVVTAGNRKTVQAPNNGIVEQILVHDGEFVNKDQPLIKLSQTHVQGNVKSLREQYLTKLAIQARLIAEMQHKPQIVFPAAIEKEKNDPRINKLLVLQNALFQSRTQLLQSEIEGYKQTLTAIAFQIQETQSSLSNKEQQEKSLMQQLENIEKLVKDGYFARNRYLELQRNLLEMQSNITEIKNRIVQLDQQKKEIELKLAKRRADHQQEVQQQLTQTQVDVNDLRNKLDSAEFELTNTTLVSPVEGTVVGLRVFTEGAIVAQGESMMDILPDKALLEVEARLPIQLIDKIAEGLPVELMFTAFNQNKTPHIQGEISLISADTLTEPKTGQPYYLLRIIVLPDEIEKLKENEIKAGMSVQAFVKTGSRTLLNYLFKPILDRVHMSLTEE